MILDQSREVVGLWNWWLQFHSSGSRHTRCRCWTLRATGTDAVRTLTCTSLRPYMSELPMRRAAFCFHFGLNVFEFLHLERFGMKFIRLFLLPYPIATVRKGINNFGEMRYSLPSKSTAQDLSCFSLRGLLFSFA